MCRCTYCRGKNVVYFYHKFFDDEDPIRMFCTVCYTQSFDVITTSGWIEYKTYEDLIEAVIRRKLSG